MQTPPVHTLPNFNATPTPSQRQNDGLSADQQFGQVLSRQVSERQAEHHATRVAETAKPTPARNDKVNSSSASKTDNTTGAPNSAPNAGAGDTVAAAPPATAPAAPAVKSKDDAKDKPVEQQDATVPVSATDAALAASAAILALVASTTQGVANAAIPEASAAASAAADSEPVQIAANSADSATDAKKAASDAAQGKAAVPALLPGATAAGTASAKAAAIDAGAAEGPARDAPVKSADSFTAALGKAVTFKSEGEGATLKSTPALAAPTPAVSNVLPQLQQLALAITRPAGPHPGNVLAPQLGSTGWDQALGQRVVWLVAGGEQSASLTLNPPDLGPLQVVLQVTNGQADASFFSTQPEVRQALEAALPKLREMLSDAGVTLGQTSVGSGNPNQDGAARDSAGSRRGSGASFDSAATTSAPVSSRITQSGNGLVDTFA
jgi:flagellar hook-length control protein FliK